MKHNPYKNGFYADPRSPIAASPMKRPRVNHRAESSTPSNSTAASLDVNNQYCTSKQFKNQILSPGMKKNSRIDEEILPMNSMNQEEDEEEEDEEDPSDDGRRLLKNLNEEFEEQDHSNGSIASKWGGGVYNQVYGLFSPMLNFLGAGGRNSVSDTSLSFDSIRRSNSTLNDSTVSNASSTCPEIETPTKCSTLEVSGVAESEESEGFDFDPYYYMKILPPYMELKEHHRPVSLPPKCPQAPKICLVLDLDETLVHCGIDEFEHPDLTFQVDVDGEQYDVQVKKRPHMEYFLEAVSQMFEVVLFTASQRIYAEKLLELIDPEKKLLRHRLYRDHCLPVDGNFLKDLNVLGRDLSKVALVDNSPHAFAYQISNGIPIESWFDDEKDNELIKLLPFLKSLLPHDDVRPLLQRQFQIEKLIDEATP